MTQSDLMRAQGYTDRDLIESIVNNYFILDYGVITKVNEDKTVNVQHAKIPVMSDGTKLPALQTNGIELLTLSGAGFSIDAGTKAGDKVLLLGLKDYVPTVNDVTGATEQTAYVHYRRDSLKALPLCTFSGEAQVKVVAEEGSLKINVDQKIELNGNSKNFVTWAELNSALSQFLTSLNTALKAATYVNAGGTPTVLAWASPLPGSIDISKAKTENIVTG